jgi:hypothetical protein
MSVVSQLIKAQIKTKVQSCASVQEVHTATDINPKGWPAVFIELKRITGEFSSNAEDSRVYQYSLQVQFPLGQDMAPENLTTPDRMEYAQNVIETVIDEIINAIDTDFELDGSPVLFVEASDVDWGYIDIEGGVARAAEIIISVYTEKTVK